jgi:hypothetical protein
MALGILHSEEAWIAILALGLENHAPGGSPSKHCFDTLQAEVPMSKRLAVLTLVALFAFGAFGQVATSVRSGPQGFNGSMHFGALPPFGMMTVTGAPYSGEEVSETVQTLADGTHITQTMPGTKVYRDSLGRTRTERPMFMRPVGMGPAAADAPVIIEIIDPVAQAKYTLDTQNKVAHRQEMAASNVRPPTVVAPGGARIGVATGGSASGMRSSFPVPMGVVGQADVARPQMASEKLGTQTIEGVAVEGTRRTMTWPVGSQGNDRPITSTTDMWVSPELKVNILTKTSDPRSGERTQKLINISRSEPDASLFQPPPDYTVVEEKGDFTIQWGSQPQ